MLAQLVVGSLVVSFTVAIEAVFIVAASRTLTRIGSWLVVPPHAHKTVLTLILVTLWLLAALSIGVWAWAVVLIAVGAFDALEPALYFSVVTFTTLGFGDITLAEPWRLLSGISAANGLMLFGLNTAFLFEMMRRLRQAQEG